jgi:Fic family protein
MDPISDGSSAWGREIEITWNGQSLAAWVPNELAGKHLQVGVRAARMTERAAAAIVAGGRELPRFASVAMLLLRAEGVASSFIEGIRMPLVDVAAAEAGASGDRTARYISDNLTAVVDALHDSRAPLSIDTLNSWHRALMATNSGLEARMIGAVRDAQSWIGGTSPRDAAYVPPPPFLIAPLMEDLIAFVNSNELDAVTQAAVAHAQFEAIHPYGDGNGRIGRILIGWILARRLSVDYPPPVSIFIARDPGGYLSGLTLFRMGRLDIWVEWVASALQHASETASLIKASSEELYEDWLKRLSVTRDDASARRVIDLLGEHPVISSDMVAMRLGISERSSRTALRTLSDLAIVRPYELSVHRPGRPRQFWVAGELIELVSGSSIT